MLNHSNIFQNVTYFTSLYIFILYVFSSFNNNVNAAPLEHVSCTVESGSHLDRPSGTMAVILGP